MEGNFIIHCPVCYEYWPKHVLRLISEEAILECPSKACHGLLKIRKDLTDQEVEQELPEEKGKKENEENLI